MKKTSWALDLVMCVVAFVPVYLFFNLNRHYFDFYSDPLFSKAVHTGMDWSFLTPLYKFLMGLGIATVLWSWIRIFPALLRLSHPLYREERALTPHVPGFWIRQGLFEAFVRSFLPFLVVFPYVLFWLYLLFHGLGFILFLLDFLTIFFGAVVLTLAGATDCLARMARPGSRIGVVPAIVIWVALVAGLGFMTWSANRIDPETCVFLGLPPVLIVGLPFLLVRWKQACRNYFQFEKETEEEFEYREGMEDEGAVSNPDEY